MAKERMMKKDEQLQIFRRARLSVNTPDAEVVADQNDGEVSSLPELVDFNAANNPCHMFCVQHNLHGLATEISFYDLKVATIHCQEWLVCRVKKQSAQTQGAVALFLESDILIFIYLVAFLRAGIPCLLLSARLSDAAVQHLVEKTKTSTIVVSTRTRGALEANFSRPNALSEQAEEARYPQLLQSPPLGFFLSSQEGNSGCDQPAAFKHPDEGCDALILHSSGSTGLPKPIYLSHKYPVGYAACHEFPPDSDESASGRNLSTLPLYHGFGLLAPCLALSTGKCCVLMPSASIPNAFLVCSIIRSHEITSLMTVPSILEECASLKDDDLQLIKGLDFVAVGGGAMKPSVARALSERGVRLVNHFGATEIGALAPIFRPSTDYNCEWLVLRKDLSLEIHELGVDDDGRMLGKLIAHPFGWSKPFELQDLLELDSSTGRVLVKVLGRKDDLIVLKTGEKVSPALWETALMSNPLIKTAVVFGESRFQLGTILEPSDDASSLSIEQLVDEIWPLVESINLKADNHAKIPLRSAFVLKPKHLELPRSDKGSIQRREVYNMFASVIDEAYANLEEQSSQMFDEVLNTPNDFSQALRNLAAGYLPAHIHQSNWNQDTNFFELGMDSLQATQLHRIVLKYLNTKGKVGGTGSQIVPNLIYAYPTLRLLSNFIQNGNSRSITTSQDRANYMLETQRSFRIANPSNAITRKWGNVVVLTGATGSLGSNLVDVLSNRRDVQDIICLVRPNPGFTASIKFKESLRRQGITLTESQMSKIKLVPWKPGDSQLGISATDYDMILQTATHVFHGAWPMNFNLSLLSLQSQIRVVSSLISLCLEISKFRPEICPRFLFASSIAVVGRYATCMGGSLVPEAVLDDPLVTVPMGYAEAKWICEHMIQDARENYFPRMDCAVIRIGQISGSTRTGLWSPDEHIPRMLRASQVLGFLPNITADASWLPVDEAANSASEILLNNDQRHLLYHLENPIRQSWKDILAVVQQEDSFRSLPIIEFTDWLRLAEANESSLGGLLWFFQDYFLPIATGKVTLSTANSVSASVTLRSTGSVGIYTLQLYLASWKKLGIL